MSDKFFLKDYENVITEFCNKNDGSKVTGSESSKNLENIKNKLNEPKKITFKVEVAGSKKSKIEKKCQNIFQTENNINNNINIFSDTNLSFDLLQDYNKNFRDGDNELNKDIEALEDSDYNIFLNLGSNNPSFNRTLIQNNNNININNKTENNVINHSISLSSDGSEVFKTKTIIIGKGLI